MSKPKAGFDTNPQNINTNGRPKKGYSITEWFKEMLNSKPEVKDAIGKSITKKALEGDTAAMKMVWNYMDGLPKGTNEQNNTIMGDVNILQIQGMNDEQLEARLAEIRARRIALSGGEGDQASE